MADEAEDVEQRAELHDCSWNLEPDASIDHRAGTERPYASLLARIPKHDHRVKLEGLRAADSNHHPPPRQTMPTMSNELRVFISSTFRDLQEEREHLVKKVFPEIRALCRERGVTFTDVDLRWGLTEQDAMLGQVIRTCLEEVDKCRPYFIGIIGNRYGWVPELHEILMDPELLAKYPFVEELAIDGASVTEMEFVHGVFDAPQVDGAYAFFYHRTTDSSDADDARRLSALVERVRSTGRPIREFVRVEDLGDVVRADLVDLIDRNWPEGEAPSELQTERRFHSAFAASRVRAYIPNPTYLKEFTSWFAEGTDPLVITAESGLGKSSLVAYLAEYHRKKHPTSLVIEHYVGASQTSGTATSVMRHIIEEVRDRFAIDEPVASKPEDLQRSFPNWLFRCEHLADQAEIDVLIVIDAVNQLDEAGQRLAWLPETIPAGAKLVISTTPGDVETRLIGRGWSELNVVPLEDERVRQSIVVRYLGEFHKGIAPQQLQMVVSDAKASSPLFLRVVAEELRLHGEHETLSDVIRRYVSSADLDEVFQAMLERLEHDYGEERMRAILELIWGSRSGLSETELLELSAESRLELSRVLFALDYHLIRHDGLLGFFHDYLRRAVEHRYLSDAEQHRRVHQQLAGYFKAAEPDQRIAIELLWQYRQANDDAEMAEFLGRPEILALLHGGPGVYDILQQWAWLRTLGHDPSSVYRRSVTAAIERSEVALEPLVRVGGLLEKLGEWSASIEIHHQVLSRAVDAHDSVHHAVALRGLGKLYINRGEYDEALVQLSAAQEVFERLGDRIGVSGVIAEMGNLHFSRGEYGRALECYRQALSMSEELGDRRGVASAIGNLGNVYAVRGEIDDALECERQLLTISEELGDRSGVARAIGNLGSLYADLGEYDRALEFQRRLLAISEELGDRVWASSAIGNMGGVHFNRGEYDQAVECYRRKLAICEELGDRSGVAMVVGNMGLAYSHCGEYDQAMECYRKALAICEELGERGKIVSAAIGHIALLHVDLGEYDQALEAFHRARASYEESGDRIGFSIATGNMGSVYIPRGEYDQALECFNHALEEHRSAGFLHGVTYWLKGRVQVLLELIRHPQMPGYLRTLLPEATPANWHDLALQCARRDAEECLAISTHLHKPDTQFASQLLLARVESAEGSVGDGLRRLEELLEQVSDDAERADLNYWQWRLSSDREANRSEAMRLYQQLFEKAPKHVYRTRLAEMGAAIEPIPPKASDAVE